MSNTYVFGSTGFIGAELVKNESFIGVNRDEYDLLSEGDFPFHLGIEDSVVFAAGIPRSKSNGPDDKQNNIQMITTVLKNLKGKRYKNFIFLSSVEIYGQEPTLPITEATKTTPENFYAEGKLKAEELIVSSLEKFTILRLPGIFGEGSSGGFLKTVSERLNQGLKVSLSNKGETLRDFVSVGDLSNLISLLSSKDGRGEILNVATGNSHSLKEYVEILGGGEIELESERGKDFNLVFDVSKLKESYPNFQFSDIEKEIKKLRRGLGS